jgi:hypothetical protein
MTYYAQGIKSVVIDSIVIDGDPVDVDRLVAAWRVNQGVTPTARDMYREAHDKVSKERDEAIKARDAYKTAHDKVAVDLNTVQSEARKARVQISRERDMYTGIVKERDAAIKERDDARVFLEARTRERDTASECLRDISEERLSWQVSEREAHASRDRVARELTEVTRERDALKDRLADMDKRQTAQVDRLVKERDAERKTVAYLSRRLELVGEGVSTSVADVDIDVAHKSLWLVRRTDAAGKPGEYGDVIVWATDGTDAVDVVLWGGYNGAPMYGYRDRDHTTAVPLSYGDDADDQVVVAQTLR